MLKSPTFSIKIQFKYSVLDLARCVKKYVNT